MKPCSTKFGLQKYIKKIKRTVFILGKKKMDKLDALNQVEEFHRVFQHPVLEKPTIPNADRTKLRVELLREELEELKESIEKHDIVGIADALCDLQYVLSGAVLEFGLGNCFVELFNEVQRSNMSKSCASLEEAQETLNHYRDKKGIEGYYKKMDGKWLVYRNGDHKTLKSIHYQPADLLSIIKKHSL
jgi:predicted HAD superfamily Cof-like phosphohydrolase